MKTCKIYTLEHPITGEIRYVGRTTKPLSHRLSDHISDSKKGHGKTHNINWINSLTSQGLRPIISEIDECSMEDRIQIEGYWIEQFKAWGFNLNNHKIYDYSEIRSMTLEEMYGKERADQMKKNQSAAWKRWYAEGNEPWNKGKTGKQSHMFGKPKSAAAIEKTRLFNLGRKNTEQSRSNMSNARLYGRVINELDSNDKIIQTFSDIDSVILHYGFKNRTSLTSVLRGERQSLYGHNLKYNNGEF